jgi:hypothetical protein
MFSGQAPKALCCQNCLLITQKDTKKEKNIFFWYKKTWSSFVGVWMRCICLTMKPIKIPLTRYHVQTKIVIFPFFPFPRSHSLFIQSLLYTFFFHLLHTTRCKGFHSVSCVVYTHNNNGRQAMIKMQNNAQSPTIVCDCVLFSLLDVSRVRRKGVENESTDARGVWRRNNNNVSGL